MTSAERFFPHVLHLVLVGSLQTNKQFAIDGHTHRIHGAGIYANIWGIWMVNVTIYSIHGSYGIEIVDLPIKNVGANNPLKFSNNPLN